jgi:hypothetical protein
MNLSSNERLFFSPEELEELNNEFDKIPEKFSLVLKKYRFFLFKNDDTHEYVYNGFLRRIETLKYCMENIWNICPPDQSTKPTRETLFNLNINLQSFIFNMYGCVDNLAWILVKAKLVSIEKNLEVNFLKEKFNKQLPSNFKEYLEKRKDWFEHLKNYRDPLAHRIPLYVVPYVLNEEEQEKFKKLGEELVKAVTQGDLEKYEELLVLQNQLGKFNPIMTHSYKENSKPIPFHAQILADWNTIIEFSNEFLQSNFSDIMRI